MTNPQNQQNPRMSLFFKMTSLRGITDFRSLKLHLGQRKSTKYYSKETVLKEQEFRAAE